jgi:hypothetical protein
MCNVNINALTPKTVFIIISLHNPNKNYTADTIAIISTLPGFGNLYQHKYIHPQTRFDGSETSAGYKK